MHIKGKGRLAMLAVSAATIVGASGIALSQGSGGDAAIRAYQEHLKRMEEAERAASQPKAAPAAPKAAAPVAPPAKAAAPVATPAAQPKAAAPAQPAAANQDSTAATDAATERGLEQYRRMMRDDPWSNPALLDVDRGETLWAAQKGPEKVALADKCDLGKGPGKVDGAFAELPRYFEDVDRVMDAETRILWCMEKFQAFDSKAFRKSPHPGGGSPVKDIGAIATFVASKSAGMKLSPPMAHAKEKEAVALGEALFNRRQGPFDFACASCHADSGKRIRLQPLPFLSKPSEARAVIGEWPAYRVSSTHVMTMQHRLLDCYWQMRLHRLEFGSEASVALTAYLNDKARDGNVAAPGLKR